jgi:hypothetical protein
MAYCALTTHTENVQLLNLQKELNDDLLYTNPHITNVRLVYRKNLMKRYCTILDP